MALTAEPQHRSPELAAHLAGCSACAAFAAEMNALDARILKALEVPVPAAAHGALAVLVRGAADGGADVEEIGASVKAAVRYLD